MEEDASDSEVVVEKAVAAEDGSEVVTFESLASGSCSVSHKSASSSIIWRSYFESIGSCGYSVRGVCGSGLEYTNQNSTRNAACGFRRCSCYCHPIIYSYHYEYRLCSYRQRHHRTRWNWFRKDGSFRHSYHTKPSRGTATAFCPCPHADQRTGPTNFPTVWSFRSFDGTEMR